MAASVSKPFNLIPWFLGLSLVSITLIGLATSVLLTRFLTERILQQDVEVTKRFVQSLVNVQLRAGAIGPTGLAQDNIDELFAHVISIPDVVQANIFNTEKTILGSSQQDLVGKRFDDNPELDSALGGETLVTSGFVDENNLVKAEHLHLSETGTRFVEIYMPVRDPDSGAIAGVVEVYRIPNALFDAIQAGNRLVWLSALLGGAFLFVTLFWVVRKASHLIASQQERLVEAETFGVLGEMASAVAHGIRNPLASIRSSAELWQDNQSAEGRASACDIVSQVDRLEKWVRELLTYSQPQHDQIEAVDLINVLTESLDYFEREIMTNDIKVAVHFADDMPKIQGDAALIGQVLNSLITNALEAMPNGGRLAVAGIIIPGGKNVELTLSDSGVGIASDQLASIFKPFFTTKPNGMGVGLELVRRIQRRLGGAVRIESTLGRGTTVILNFRIA